MTNNYHGNGSCSIANKESVSCTNKKFNEKSVKLILTSTLRAEFFRINHCKKLTNTVTGSSSKFLVSRKISDQRGHWNQKKKNIIFKSDAKKAITLNVMIIWTTPKFLIISTKLKPLSASCQNLRENKNYLKSIFRETFNGPIPNMCNIF